MKVLAWIMAWIVQNAWAMWLGGCLSSLGYNFLTWQFWVVLVPCVVLEASARELDRCNSKL
jgi:hypothetical protein